MTGIFRAFGKWYSKNVSFSKPQHKTKDNNKLSLSLKLFDLFVVGSDGRVCFSCASLPPYRAVSFTQLLTHPVTGEYSLYTVGSIRCISWWWKVVLMWCLQSSTGEMDIWSSLWPSLTPGLLPDLISLLLRLKVGTFERFFNLLGNIVYLVSIRGGFLCATLDQHSCYVKRAVRFRCVLSGK